MIIRWGLVGGEIEKSKRRCVRSRFFNKISLQISAGSQVADFVHAMRDPLNFHF